MSAGPSAAIDGLSELFLASLEGVTRATTIGESAGAVCQLFERGLPCLLHHYGELLADYWDLSRAVKTTLPVMLCWRIQGVVRSRPVSDLYPRHVRLYISRAVELLEWRIEPGGDWLSGPALQPAIPADPTEVHLLADLEDVVRRFGASVLIGGPPPPPATVDERAVARHRRLQQYVEVWRLQGMKVTFSDVCRTAGVRRDGRGSELAQVVAQHRGRTGPDE